MPGPSPQSHTIIIDSGSTGHYFATGAPLHNVQPTKDPLPVRVANQDYMHSTHTAELPIASLPKAAKQAHIFPALGNTSLLSVPQLCDTDCVATFTKNKCTITFEGQEIITGTRNPGTDGLWTTVLPTQSEPQAFPAIHNQATPANLVVFAHAALFSPALSTLDMALSKGFLPPFTGLSRETLRKYPPHSEATVMGHLDNKRKNIQSTKKTKAAPDDIDYEFPVQPADTTRTNLCYLSASEPKHLVYTDQTGRLPSASSAGNKYLLVAYDYDSNCILLRPIRNRQADTLTKAIADIHATLSRGGCKPQFHRLDNECSQELRDYFLRKQIQYQLAPPNDHRINAAERAIRTSKNHLGAGWFSVDDKFPMHLWDKTCQQAELTLNILRGSRINPKLSAWEQIHGRYDFNKCPIAPPGIKVLAHEKPDNRATWSPHAFTAWYVGPALQHYRCYTVWATETRQLRIVNQLKWFPQKIAMPIATPLDLLRAAIVDLQHILTAPPEDALVGTLPPSEVDKLVELAEVIAQVQSQPQKQAPGASQKLPPVPTQRVPRPPGPPPRPPAPVLRVVPEGSLRGPHQPDQRRGHRARQLPVRFRSDQANFGHTVIRDPTYCAYPAVHPDTGEQAEYKALSQSSEGPRWIIGMCKEFGRLFQGYKCPTSTHDTQGTSTCAFITKDQIPNDKKPTYVRIVSEYREQKADPYRVRLTVGGNLIDFPGDVATKTADLVTIKALMNDIISTPGARARAIDIKDFYLNNPLPSKEYIRFHKDIIPEAIWAQYNLDDYVDHNGYVYAEVSKGMYGLPQAGRVASDTLIPRLQAAGYKPTGRTPGLFKHISNSIKFGLIVDDFLAKACTDEDYEHLKATLRAHYTITVDDKAERFCGMTLDWNYDAGYVDISMPGYVEKALQRFTHPKPTRPQHAPSKWSAINYGAPIQYAEPEDTSEPLNPLGISRLRQIIGTFLFYGRAVDSTMMVALGSLAAAQSNGTAATMDAAVHLLNYAATHPDATVRMRKSDMILYVHSDASYLSEPKARSRVGGYFYLGGKDEPPDNPQPNGAIHIESRIMRNIMASASEAETGALFHNGQEAAHIRQILKELDREQPGPTRMTTDNSTADGFANDRTKIKRSKAMDMRFYWIQDRVRQGDLEVGWLQGKNNLADYFTKHHPPAHHIKMRPTYLHTSNLAHDMDSEWKGVLI
jgi:hypothetical protein